MGNLYSITTNQEATSEPKRPIAVLVDREGLGDALLKLPMLRGINRTFPGHPVWWIARHQTSMARELTQFIEGLIFKTVEQASIDGSLREMVSFFCTLPSFEAVFDTRTRVTTVVAARFYLRHRQFYACLPGFLFSSRRPSGRFFRPRGIAARALSMIEAASGGAVDWRGTLTFSTEAADFAARELPTGPAYIGLAPGSREARKNWPLDRYIALAKALSARGLTPVFIIGPQEQAWLSRLQANVPDALFPDVAGSLDRSIATGHRLSAAVANDSGIGHLLASIGVPLVSLFGPSDPERWAPLTRQGIILNAKDFGGKTMDAIPVDAVRDAVAALASRAPLADF